MQLFDLNNEEIKDGKIEYFNEFIEFNKANEYFDKLVDEIDWEQEQMKMYGRVLNFPRLTAWYGDNGLDYSYAGLDFKAKDWTPSLIELKEKLESLADEKFNSVLLNYYRDGQDSMAWHADDEKELGINPTIASLSFGEERKFQIKHKQTKERKDYLLSNGSLLIMSGKFQHNWLHQIPKSQKISKGRINLTFRRVKGVE